MDRESGFRAGVRQGVRLCLPGYLPTLVFAAAVGALSQTTGLSALETFLMTSLVAAGASQVVALGMWAEPMPMLALGLTTLVVNLRFMLMTASTSPWLDAQPFKHVAGTAFMHFDINWAIAMREVAEPAAIRWGMLVGGGVMIYAFWVSGTMIGYAAGGLVADPRLIAVDVVIAAFFAAILVPGWAPSKTAIAWTVAAVTATVIWWTLGGYWHVAAGAVIGAVAGAIATRPDR